MLLSTRYDERKLDELILPNVHDVSNPGDMSKDGKQYYSNYLKSPGVFFEVFKKLMRK